MNADVVVVGAGPVGLLLACQLEQGGLRTLVFERRLAPCVHSRAIGVHRPSLIELDRIGIAERFIREGVRVFGGAAIADGRTLGKLRFDELDGPFPFALSLPQSDTERLLEETLHRLAPHALRRGCEVIEVIDGSEVRRVVARDQSGMQLEVEGRYVVGCDGQSSLVRRCAGIGYRGGAYPDSFVMGDFADHTPFGDEARLFLSGRGLVESFPLPRGRRRWVVSTQERVETPVLSAFCQLVRERTGCGLDEASCTMLSGFGIEHRLADSFARGSIALAGDAAHVVSPIGGQGLNAGWMDARDLAGTLMRIVRDGLDPARELGRYASRARVRAKRIRRRAAFNTYLGRTTLFDGVRNAVVRGALHTRARKQLARVFSMQGL